METQWKFSCQRNDAFLLLPQTPVIKDEECVVPPRRSAVSETLKPVPSSTHNHSQVRAQTFARMMLDVDINWGSWPLTTWLDALCCFLLIGWLDNGMNSECALQEDILTWCSTSRYLFSVAVELCQNVEERDLRDDQLLFLVLVERRCGQVEREVQKRGLQHLLLILLLLQQRLLLFCRL